MHWTDTGKETEPDRKHRVSLGTNIKTPPGVRYKVMHNEFGQILLDPVKSVPAKEAWIYENQEIIDSIRLGITQAEKGQLVEIDLGPDDGEDA
jgi:hypothetical protein